MFSRLARPAALAATGAAGAAGVGSMLLFAEPASADATSVTTALEFCRPGSRAAGRGSDNSEHSCLTIFHGTVVHSRGPSQLEIVEEGYLGVRDGKIEFLQSTPPESQPGSQIIELGEKLLLPGFVDAHAHAPQHAFAGTGYDLKLLDWLMRYTFPTEAKFADLDFARTVHNHAVRAHLRHGTTTCCYFASIHVPASLQLCDTVSAYGQRALIGKVSMDRNSPDFYVETTEAAIHDAEDFVQQVLSRKNPLLTPVVTPRFVPTCTPELMRELGGIAARYGVPVQSHISENRDEIEWVRALHPEVSSSATGSSYADVYDTYGLLGPSTIMAHAVYLEPREVHLMARVGAGVVHCPNSNFSLGSGVCPVRTLMENGVKVGLGTDVAGGYAVSMLDAMRGAIIASHVACNFSEGAGKLAAPTSDDESLPAPTSPLTLSEVFYLATVGSSRVLGIDNRVGNFEVGKEFDAMVIDPLAQDSDFHVYPEADTAADVLSKFVFRGDDRNIEAVYVAGQKVVNRASSALPPTT